MVVVVVVVVVVVLMVVVMVVMVVMVVLKGKEKRKWKREGKVGNYTLSPLASSRVPFGA